MRRTAPRTFLAASLLLLAGCRSASLPQAAVGAPGSSPSWWGLTEADWPSQRLFRAEVRQRGEHASLRLILRLWSPDRFELSASDAVGRTLWRYAADGGLAAWFDRAAGGACRHDPSRPLRWPRLGLALSARDLPALLLGRLPEPPAGSVPAAVGVGTFRWEDSGGRQWQAEVDAEGLLGWRTESQGVALRWRRESGGSRLEIEGGETEVRWRQVASEPQRGGSPRLPSPLDGVPECALEDLP